MAKNRKEWPNGTITEATPRVRGRWIAYTDVHGDPDEGEDRAPIRVAQADIYYGVESLLGHGCHYNVWVVRGRRINHEMVHGDYPTYGEALDRALELREWRREGIFV